MVRRLKRLFLIVGGLLSRPLSPVEWAHAVLAQANNPRIARKRQLQTPPLGNRGGFFMAVAWLLSYLAIVSRRLSPYLTPAINIHLKTICCVIKNLRVALHLEK